MYREKLIEQMEFLESRQKNCSQFDVDDVLELSRNILALANAERDERNYQKLNDLGWKVLIIWECELRTKVKEITLKNIVAELENKNECDQ